MCARVEALCCALSCVVKATVSDKVLRSGKEAAVSPYSTYMSTISCGIETTYTQTREEEAAW
jgi:hypothetical protein